MSLTSPENEFKRRDRKEEEIRKDEEKLAIYKIRKCKVSFLYVLIFFFFFRFVSDIVPKIM